MNEYVLLIGYFMIFCTRCLSSANSMKGGRKCNFQQLKSVNVDSSVFSIRDTVRQRFVKIIFHNSVFDHFVTEFLGLLHHKYLLYLFCFWAQIFHFIFPYEQIRFPYNWKQRFEKKNVLTFFQLNRLQDNYTPIKCS